MTLKALIALMFFLPVLANAQDADRGRAACRSENKMELGRESAGHRPNVGKRLRDRTSL